MYLSSDYQYLIDKDLKLYKINLKHELNITGETLLDGELTKYKEKRKGIVNPLLFVVNDAITINANTIIEENLYDRLEKLKIFIEEVGQAFYFDFQIQIYYKIYDIERAINQIIPTSLAYQPDGILFVPCNKPYKRGYSKAILKWKPPSLMTIDFLVKKAENDELHVFVRTSEDNLKDYGKLDTEGVNNVESLVGKVVNCSYNMNKNTWKMNEKREEGAYPSADWLAENNFNLMKENITKDKLITYVLNINKGDKVKKNVGGGRGSGNKSPTTVRGKTRGVGGGRGRAQQKYSLSNKN